MEIQRVVFCHSLSNYLSFLKPDHRESIACDYFIGSVVVPDFVSRIWKCAPPGTLIMHSRLPYNWRYGPRTLSVRAGRKRIRETTKVRTDAISKRIDEFKAQVQRMSTPAMASSMV